MFQQVQTIFKSMIIPTPEGEAGVGVLRISGDRDDRRIFLGLISLISGFLSPGVRIPESGKLLLVEFWNPGLWNPESGMPITTEILNVNSTDKESEIQDPRRRIQNPRPSWITLHGAILLACVVRLGERFSRARSEMRGNSSHSGSPVNTVYAC